MLAGMSAQELVEWQVRDDLIGEVRSLIDQGMDPEIAARFVFSAKKGMP